MNTIPVKEQTESPKGRIAVFVGSTPNIGTTVAAFGTAVRLAVRTNASVGFVCLNLKSSKLHRYLGEDRTPFALDSLRAELKSRSMDGRRLLQFCVSFKGVPRLNTLYGTVLREQAEFYQPEDVSHLLRAAREAFDLCLVEVNAYWDNAATVCALLDADDRVAVTTPDLGHFQEDMARGLHTMGPLFGLSSDSFNLIVTQTGGSARMDGGLRTSDIRKESGMKVIGEIRRNPKLLDALNQGKLLEFIEGDSALREQLDVIAGRFMERFSLSPVPAVPRKTWIGRRQPRLSGS